MHERCWALVARVMDVDLIENNLSLFAKVMYQRIKEMAPGAYAMHERCWTISTQISDVDLIEEHITYQ